MGGIVRPSAKETPSVRNLAALCELIFVFKEQRMNVPGANYFLSNLSPHVRTALLKQAKAVELPLHTVLFEQTAAPRYGYFVLSGLASIVTERPNGESAEVCFVGREGLVGAMHLLGPAPLSTRCMMQLGGSALRVPFAELQMAFDNSTEFRRLTLEFAQQEFAMVAQIAGCNRLHNAEQRLVRWLLMAQDRVDRDTLEFTQEYLSEMIATQRTTVTITAGMLQERGLIRYSRGTIRILDRPALEAVTCSCYLTIKDLFDGLYRREPALAAEMA
jgi:CRP-like cAMP-binding protein